MKVYFVWVLIDDYGVCAMNSTRLLEVNIQERLQDAEKDRVRLGIIFVQ
jgi:hypothetical protein